MSFISEESVRHACFIPREYPRAVWSEDSRRIISFRFITALSGVRTSWLMSARNSVLAFPAASAAIISTSFSLTFISV